MTLSQLVLVELDIYQTILNTHETQEDTSGSLQMTISRAEY